MLTTNTLIWLFPIAFILHDFEELILFEPWLKKNAHVVMARFKNRVPLFVEKQLETITHKSTTQFALPICLIFILSAVSAFLAAERGQYSLFLLASSLFFLHGFMHLGQALLLRRYIPAILTSSLVAIPYGTILFWRLLETGIIDLPILLIYFAAAIVLAIPFILGMHLAGKYLYTKMIALLIDVDNSIK